MTSAVQKALTAWGDPLPAWVHRLAEEVDATSLARTGERIGYGKSAVSMVLANRYGAGTAKVEAAVTELLGLPGSAVACPVLGTIPADRCRAEQAAPFRPSSPLSRLIRANCRTCANRTDAPRTDGGDQ